MKRIKESARVVNINAAEQQPTTINSTVKRSFFCLCCCSGPTNFGDQKIPMRFDGHWL